MPGGCISLQVSHLLKSIGVEEKVMLRLRQAKGQKGEITLSLTCQDKGKVSSYQRARSEGGVGLAVCGYFT